MEAKQKDANGKSSVDVDSTVVPNAHLRNGTVVYDARTNGNGNGAAHAASNGNGNGNGAKLPSPPPVLPSKPVAVPAAPAAAAEAPAAVAPPRPAATVNGSAARAAGSALSTQSLDNAMDAQAAGQIETVAATGAAKKPTSAAGTPYANPGGRWSQFKTYSTFQVRVRCLVPAARRDGGKSGWVWVYGQDLVEASHVRNQGVGACISPH